MTPIEYVKTLRRHWLGVVVLTILGALGGYAYGESSPSVYQSTSSVLVTSEVTGNGSDLLQGANYVEDLVTTYVDLATSEKVLKPVIDELDLDTTTRSLARSITAESPLNTVSIKITVRGTDPEKTATVANAVTASLSEAVSDVSPTVAGKPAIRLTTIESANVPTVPVAPNKRRLTLIGALIGLILGAGYALARRTFGSAIADADDVARVTDLPVVGGIVEAKRSSTLPATVLENSLGVQAESLRGLSANLSFLGVDGGLKSIVVTSASPAESKSSIATATALVLAEASHKVLLIDADLRAPTVHDLTSLDNTIGLSTVLIGEDSLEVAVHQWGYEGLDVLTSGPIPPNPGQLLNSGAMSALIEKAEQSYDMIVVDSPPLLQVVDAVWLGHLVDGVLVVARRGKTTPRSLARALETLEASHTHVSGIVLSRLSRGSRKGYGYGHNAT